MRTRSVHVTGLLILGALLALPAAPALAGCHIAGFEDSSVTVSETEGVATITVVLQGGQPACAGTVDYSTVDGTAVGGDDFKVTSGTLTFITGDDREESIEVPIENDTDVEGPEQFTVALSNPAGSITGTSGPATVVITDDDVAQPSPTEEAPTTEPAPEPELTSEPAPASEPQVTSEPAPASEPELTSGAEPSSPSPTDSESQPVIQASPSPTAAPEDSDDGGAGIAVIVALIVVALLAIGGFLAARMRGGDAAE